MKINDKEFNQFGVLGVQIPWTSTMSVNNNITLAENSYWPIVGNQQLAPHNRTLIVDFSSEEGMSDFTVEISAEAILDLDDGYLYKTYLNGDPQVSCEGVYILTVSYPLYVIKMKDMVEIKNAGNECNVNGNVKTDAIFKISSTTGIQNFSLNGIMIYELKANDALIIDGIHKLVYYESAPEISAFDNVSMSAFPCLKPGVNSLEKSHDVTLEIRYYPVYM